jgi:hypothetical protein
MIFADFPIVGTPVAMHWRPQEVPMTRSIFDPEGGETEHSGQTFTPQRADQNSQMPPDVVDGKVSEEEARDLELQANPDAPPANQDAPGQESDEGDFRASNSTD